MKLIVLIIINLCIFDVQTLTTYGDKIHKHNHYKIDEEEHEETSEELQRLDSRRNVCQHNHYSVNDQKQTTSPFLIKKIKNSKNNNKIPHISSDAKSHKYENVGRPHTTTETAETTMAMPNRHIIGADCEKGYKADSNGKCRKEF